MPPSYGSQEYWEQRFACETDPFEWLEAPHVLDPYLLDALSTFKEPYPQLLHIGCGTSMLSCHLRTMVQIPRQVHNIDYSKNAIRLGKDREIERYKAKRNDNDCKSTNTTALMRWDAVDLLDHTSLLKACEPGKYSIIVDKSTSDCIACADDVDTPLPFPIDVRSAAFAVTDFDLRQMSEPVHPLHVMAIYLALVTKPGARWIALSYSDDRFPFVDGLHTSSPLSPRLPDTSTLWKLLDKRAVESGNEREGTKDSSSSDSSGNDDNWITYRPKISNWVYVLERTEVSLYVRGGHV
jgi:hypothetical protein